MLIETPAAGAPPPLLDPALWLAAGEVVPSFFADGELLHAARITAVSAAPDVAAQRRRPRRGEVVGIELVSIERTSC
jgi:hypothetical protein